MAAFLNKVSKSVTTWYAAKSERFKFWSVFGSAATTGASCTKIAEFVFRNYLGEGKIVNKTTKKIKYNEAEGGNHPPSFTMGDNTGKAATESAPTYIKIFVPLPAGDVKRVDFTCSFILQKEKDDVGGGAEAKEHGTDGEDKEGADDGEAKEGDDDGEAN